MTGKQLEHALTYAKHSLYLEGMELTADDEHDIRAVLLGKMTRKQLIEKLKQEDSDHE
jgi:hypothetical protein